MAGDLGAVSSWAPIGKKKGHWRAMCTVLIRSFVARGKFAVAAARQKKLEGKWLSSVRDLFFVGGLDGAWRI